MANSSYLGDDGIIYSVYEGELDGESVRASVDQTWPLIDERIEAKLPVLALADLRAVTRVSLSARQYAGKALTQWPYDKIALWGASAYLRHVANLIALATHHGHNVRTFDDASAAKEWLLEPLPTNEH